MQHARVEIGARTTDLSIQEISLELQRIFPESGRAHNLFGHTKMADLRSQYFGNNGNPSLNSFSLQIGGY